jgi:predicted dehydrogenase
MKIKMGIVGAGGRGVNTFGKIFAQQFHNKVEIAALADTNKIRAQAAREELGVNADIFEDAEELCKRKDINTVVITSPDYLHEELCLTAFKYKKNVLVDKPLAITAKGCLKIIEASRSTKKLLYMGFNLRHSPVLKKLKQLCSCGAFGEIFAMRAVEYYDGGKTYMARWNRLKKFSGSLWIHKGSHDFDILNWLAGKARPYQVSCFANIFTLNDKHLPFEIKKGIKPGPTCSECHYFDVCPDKIPDYRIEQQQSAGLACRMFGKDAALTDSYHKDVCIYLSKKDTHDNGMAIVEYNNGIIAMHSECFVTPITNRIYSIDGTKAHCDVDLDNYSISLIERWNCTRNDIKVQQTGGGHGGADPAMCAEFIRCLEQNIKPSASGIDGAWSVAIGEACEKSKKERRIVKISEVLDIKNPLLKP